MPKEPPCSLSPWVVTRPRPSGKLELIRLGASGGIVVLEGIAAEAVSLMNGKRGLTAIREELIRKYDPPRRRFGQDFDHLIHRLRKERVIL